MTIVFMSRRPQSRDIVAGDNTVQKKIFFSNNFGAAISWVPLNKKYFFQKSARKLRAFRTQFVYI